MSAWVGSSVYFVWPLHTHTHIHRAKKKEKTIANKKSKHSNKNIENKIELYGEVGKCFSITIVYLLIFLFRFSPFPSFFRFPITMPSHSLWLFACLLARSGLLPSCAPSCLTRPLSLRRSRVFCVYMLTNNRK